MPGNAKKEDLRIQKTRKALYAALLSLLSRQRFTKITVHNICKESMVSKTAFYAHFKDKYDLLGQWLAEQKKWLAYVFVNNSGPQAEEMLFEFLQAHSMVIINLFTDADWAQQKILYRFFSLQVNKNAPERNAVLVDFFAGGLFHVVACRMKNCRRTTKDEIRKIITYVHAMVKMIIHWDMELSG